MLQVLQVLLAHLRVDFRAFLKCVSGYNTVIAINFISHFQGCWEVQGCNQGLPTSLAKRPGRPHCDGARPTDRWILSGRLCQAEIVKRIV